MFFRPSILAGAIPYSDSRYSVPWKFLNAMVSGATLSFKFYGKVKTQLIATRRFDAHMNADDCEIN